MEHLSLSLQLYASRPLKIGAFSAASNVTGAFLCIIVHICIFLYTFVYTCTYVYNCLIFSLPSPPLVYVGILTDVDAVCVAMHRAGGIAVFDYATAAPYVKVRTLYRQIVHIILYINVCTDMCIMYISYMCNICVIVCLCVC